MNEWTNLNFSWLNFLFFFCFISSQISTFQLRERKKNNIKKIIRNSFIVSLSTFQFHNKLFKWKNKNEKWENKPPPLLPILSFFFHCSATYSVNFLFFLSLFRFSRFWLPCADTSIKTKIFTESELHFQK